jgi:hypothetical protein
MEIEFNTNRVSKPDPILPIFRRNAARAKDDTSFENIKALEDRLKEIPQVRPEKVEFGKAVVADLQYPPEQVLRSLTILLALKFK